MNEIIIVGAGPAGLTAAIYAARAGKNVKVYEKDSPGGQITYSPLVDNYPGIPHMGGSHFAEKITEQVKELGVDIIQHEVTGVEPFEGGFRILTADGGEDAAKAVILATGVAHRSLGLEGEEDLIGCGLSFCAVCDGPFYKDAEVAVVGGGDTALQDAVFLASVCSRVTLVHRRDTFRGEARLVKRILENPKIEIIYNSEVQSYLTEEGEVRGLVLKDKITGLTQEINVDGVFLAVGQKPQNEAFKELIDMDEQGYFYAGEDALTNIDGIYAAGDARIKSVRQLTTAVGDGAQAAMAACSYLDNL